MVDLQKEKRPAARRAFKNSWVHSKDTMGVCQMETKSETLFPKYDSFPIAQRSPITRSPEESR